MHEPVITITWSWHVHAIKDQNYLLVYASPAWSILSIFINIIYVNSWMHADCAGNLLKLASLPLHRFNLSPPSLLLLLLFMITKPSSAWLHESLEAHVLIFPAW